MGEKRENKYNHRFIFSKEDQFFGDNTNKLFTIIQLLIDLLHSNLKDLDNSHLLAKERQGFFRAMA